MELMTNYYYPAARLLLSIRSLLLCIPAICMLATAAAAAAVPPAHWPAGCRSRCGDVDIPYPFGIGDRCAINHGFNLSCLLVNGTERPFSGAFEVTNISVPRGKAWMKVYISWRCYDVNVAGQMKQYTSEGNFTDTPFRFSYEDNKVFVIGCNTLAYMRSKPVSDSFTCLLSYYLANKKCSLHVNSQDLKVTTLINQGK